MPPHAASHSQTCHPPNRTSNKGTGLDHTGHKCQSVSPPRVGQASVLSPQIPSASRGDERGPPPSRTVVTPLRCYVSPAGSCSLALLGSRAVPGAAVPVPCLAPVPTHTHLSASDAPETEMGRRLGYRWKEEILCATAAGCRHRRPLPAGALGRGLWAGLAPGRRSPLPHPCPAYLGVGGEGPSSLLEDEASGVRQR